MNAIGAAPDVVAGNGNGGHNSNNVSFSNCLV